MQLLSRTSLFSLLSFILISCGGGDGSSSTPETPPPQAINITFSSLPEQIYSYQRLNINVTSNYPSCLYSISGNDIHWINSNANAFEFNAPITVLEEESFEFQISSISSSSCP